MIYRKKIATSLFLIGPCLLPAVVSYGQTWDEWFQQKKTQINYLEKQIVELQLYITDLEKGYKIVQSGLQTINTIQHGDFDQHNAWFTSLLTVRSSIGQSSTVTDCDRLSAAIVQQCQTLQARLTTPPAVAAADQVYIRSVLQYLQAQTTAAMKDLSALTGNGSLSLHDEERQHRIGSIQEELIVQYRFIQRFAAQVSVMGVQRMQEQLDGQGLQQLYSLP